MKQYRSILSAAFVFLVLFSSSSFVIGVHLCGGQVQNMALFSKADGCEKEKQLPPCHRHKSAPCCQDETIVHEAQGFKGDVTQLSIATAPVVDAAQPPVLVSEIIPSSAVSRAQYYNYDPPLRSTDRIISLQVFLI